AIGQQPARDRSNDGADRLPQRPLAVGSLGAAGILGLAAFVWPGALIGSVGLGLGFGLAGAIGRPAFIAVLFNLSDRHRGGLVGLVAATNQLGQAIGAGLGGLVIGWASFSGLGPLIFALSLAAAALIVVGPKSKVQGLKSKSPK
ncbi:MAG TPA: MFS transporter, partial [Dehalococcoidia bacterium]|nr:MFS transporter [Dehalococcoidia bacterium]